MPSPAALKKRKDFQCVALVPNPAPVFYRENFTAQSTEPSLSNGIYSSRKLFLVKHSSRRLCTCSCRAGDQPAGGERSGAVSTVTVGLRMLLRAALPGLLQVDFDYTQG